MELEDQLEFGIFGCMLKDLAEEMECTPSPSVLGDPLSGIPILSGSHKNRGASLVESLQPTAEGVLIIT